MSFKVNALCLSEHISQGIRPADMHALAEGTAGMLPCGDVASRRRRRMRPCPQRRAPPPLGAIPEVHQVL